MSESLPPASAILVEFSSVLRGAGFAVSPEQTMLFVEAVGLLGPRAMTDIYRASRATLAPAPDQVEAFDALFQQHFFDATLSMPMAGDDDDEDLTIQESRDTPSEIPDVTEESESGGDATAAEVLSVRQFDAMDEADVLRMFRRRAGAVLPVRRSRRFTSARRGVRYDLKRSLREAVRRDGEVLSLAALRSKQRQRQILLLIDVSGSMKDYTDGYFRFAHTLGRVCERLEVFTVGTRLTRVTRAIKLRNQQQALTAASNVVADFDGGTRLGDALTAFLGVPRFAGFARGALVLVLSDGFERGDHDRLESSMLRISRLAWRTVWLTPLAADADYVPETEALQAVLPYIDEFKDASSVQRVCREVLDIARAA